MTLLAARFYPLIKTVNCVIVGVAQAKNSKINFIERKCGKNIKTLMNPEPLISGHFRLQIFVWNKFGFVYQIIVIQSSFVIRRSCCQ